LFINGFIACSSRVKPDVLFISCNIHEVAIAFERGHVVADALLHSGNSLANLLPDLPKNLLCISWQGSQVLVDGNRLYLGPADKAKNIGFYFVAAVFMSILG